MHASKARRTAFETEEMSEEKGQHAVERESTASAPAVVRRFAIGRCQQNPPDLSDSSPGDFESLKHGAEGRTSIPARITKGSGNASIVPCSILL